MLDATFRETVTLRRARAGARGANGAPAAYDLVRDGAEVAVRIRCRIERRRRRIFLDQGVEAEADATMLFRVTLPSVDLRTVDYVVDRNGEAFKVLGMDDQQSLFGSARYKRVDLRAT